MPQYPPLTAHNQGKPNSYLDYSVQRHTLDTTSDQHEPRSRVESNTTRAT